MLALLWTILPQEVACTHVRVRTFPLPFNQSCFCAHLCLHLLVVFLLVGRQELELSLAGALNPYSSLTALDPSPYLNHHEVRKKAVSMALERNTDRTTPQICEDAPHAP